MLELTVARELYDCGRNSCTSGATQSGALGLYCFIAVEEEGATAAGSRQSSIRHTTSEIVYIPGLRPFGLKGAALAAFGENPLVLEGNEEPFTESEAGVKLGESTFKRFFTLRVIDKYCSGQVRSRLRLHTYLLDSVVQLI